MRAVIQRVREAQVRWEGGEAAIRAGLVILLGVAAGDGEDDAERLASKILKLRIFSDEAGKFNLNAGQVNAQFLVVPQFTLFAEMKGQNRPSFLRAARRQGGQSLSERFTRHLQESGAEVRAGAFGAHMQLHLVNDGPVTLVVSTDPWETRIA